MLLEFFCKFKNFNTFIKFKSQIFKKLNKKILNNKQSQ